MTRIGTLALLLLSACSDAPSGPGREEDPGLETESCSCSATLPTGTAPTSTASLDSGRAEYDSGECPIAGRDPGLAVPDGAIVQALECDGSTCYDAADLLFVDDGEAYLVACLDAERYEIRWLAIR